MERRDFIKTSCVTCAGIIGASSLMSLLNSCAPLPVVKTSSKENAMLVPEASFIENKNMVIVKNPELEFDILLIKKKDNSYSALYMQCTHQNQPLTANKTGLFCSAHGSSFDLEGNVITEPATAPLRKFKTEVTESNNIKIYLN